MSLCLHNKHLLSGAQRTASQQRDWLLCIVDWTGDQCKLPGWLVNGCTRDFFTTWWATCAQVKFRANDIWNKRWLFSFIVTCAHFKFHCKNLISHLVICNQIQYVSWDLHPNHLPGYVNIWKCRVIQMSIPMQLQRVKIKEYPTTQGNYFGNLARA